MKKIIILIMFTFVNLIFAQTTVVNQVYLNNQTTINNCNTIDFGTVVNNNLTFYFTLTNAGQPSGTLFVRRKFSSSSNPVNVVQQNVQTVNWLNGQFIGSIACSLNEADIQVSGSTIYLEFVSSSNVSTIGTCLFPLKKTPVPTFNLSPTTASVGCGSNVPITFTVSNVYNSPGTLSYIWYTSGWKLNGVVVQTPFTTTTNSINLTPASPTVLPSNVAVYAVLNGVEQSGKTCTVTRSPYTSTANITGASSLCTTATYGISSLPPGTTVTNWSIQGSSLATLSATSGATTTLTKIGNGAVSLTARLTNTCGDSFTLPARTILIGRLPAPTTLTGPSSVGNGSLVSYQTSPVAGATSYTWWLPYPYDTVPIFDYFGQNWAKLENSTDSSLQVFTGYSGTSGVVQVMAVNACGRGSAKSISVSHTGGSGGPMPKFSNVIKDLDAKIYPNPANNVVNISINSDLAKTKVMATLYDLLGRKIQEIEVLDAVAALNIEDIPNGNYILKLEYNGEVETRQIFIE